MALDHQFSGVTTSVFVSDAKFTTITPIQPRVVRASFAKGLSFGPAQSIIEHVYTPALAAGALHEDVIIRLWGAPLLSEVMQSRVTGDAVGPAVALITVNGAVQVRLLRLARVDRPSAGTTAIPGGVPSDGTPFRIGRTVDGPNLSASVYLNQTTTIAAETLTSTLSDDVDITALRLGVISGSGLGTDVRVELFNPVASQTAVPGPRTWPALPAEPPQVVTAASITADPWQRDVLLSATTIAETDPVASVTWQPAAGTTVPLTAGEGAVRLLTPPGTLDVQQLAYEVTATDTAGRVSAPKTTTVTVRPATRGIWLDGALMALDSRVFDEFYVQSGPTPTPTLKQIVVSGFRPLPTQQTSQQYEFSTNQGVLFTRISEWREFTTPSSTLPWTTHDIRERTDTHTATIAGWTAGYEIEGRFTLTAPGFQTLVLTANEYPALRFVSPAEPAPADPTPDPAPTGVKLRHAPRVLEDPLTINIPVTGGGWNIPDTRDVLVVMPDQPVTGQISINGCRNIVLIGGETRGDGPMQASLKIENFAGTLFVEGLIVDPTGVGNAAYPTTKTEDESRPPYYADGFRINSTKPGAKVILQNIWGRVDGIFKFADGRNGPHGDFVQSWAGPPSFIAERITVDSRYQGFFILANQFGFAGPYGEYLFRDIDVHRIASSGGAGAWTLAGPPEANVTVINCHARRDPGSNTSLASGPGTSENGWTVSTEPPPGGRFVDKTKVGIGYRSPGYADGTPTPTPEPVTLTAPTSVIGTTSGTEGTINWQPPTSGTVGTYVVARDGVDSSGYGAYSGEVSSTTRAFTFQKLVPEATYILSVRAKAADGTLGPAVTRSITVAAVPVVPPPTTGTLTVNGRTFPSINTAAGGSGLPFNSTVFTGSWNTSTADAFATWRGRPVDGMMNWVPWTGTWADTSVFPAMRATGLYILGVPLHPRGVGTTNAAVAAGTWDSEITAWARAAIAAGLNQSRVVFRLGWECNGTWYPWSWDKGGVENYIAAFRRFVDLCRAAGLTAPFWSWNLNKGPQAYNSGFSWRTGFPGKAWTDIVGIDSYDHYSPSTTLTQWESNVGVSKNPGIRDVAAFAAEQSLLWSLEEWGVANPKDTNRGGDNPYYIARSWDLLNELKANLAYEVTYDDEGAPSTLNHKLSNGTNPLAAAAYRASSRWGS